MDVKKLSHYASALAICLTLSACSSYNTQQSADDFFDGAITNSVENHKKSDSGVSNTQPSATADTIAGIFNVGFNWLASLFQTKQD